MPLVLPQRGQPDWDVTNNNALTYLQSAIEAASSTINGVTVSGTPNADEVLTATSAATAHWAPTTGAGALLAVNNLDDLPNVVTARTNLGLGTAATAATSAFDPSGAATAAQTNAEAYTDAQLAAFTTRADIFDVTKHGAVGNGKFITTGSITSGQAILTDTSSSNPWTSNDVGKKIMIKGAAAVGITSLIGTISTFTNANQIIVSVNATTTIANALVLWATDDTSAIQTTINLATAYAALHGAATVFFPTGAGYYYGIGGALITGGSTKGNSQLTIPIVSTVNNKSNLIFLGVANGSILQHWQQTVPQFSGSTLVSFGVFSSSGAQTTSIDGNGNAAVIGGPSQPSGYGVAPGIYSNVGVTFQDMSILTAYSANGLNYSAGDMSGISNCNLFDFAYGTTGIVPNNDFQTTNSFANGLSIGWLMPANGNNDNCAIRNVTCHGGFTFGFFATEHTSVDAMRILYCWSGFCPVGVYFNSVGATHAFWVNQISIEACNILVNIVGAGSNGIGPFLQIDQLDTETSAPVFADRNSGVALAAALGTIRLTGLYTPSNVSTGGLPTGLKIIDGQRAYPVTSVSSNYSVLITDNTILVNATSGPVSITLISAAWTPNTYTIKKTDSSANAVTVHTINSETIQGTGAPASTYSLPSQGNSVSLYPARVSSAWNWYTK